MRAVALKTLQSNLSEYVHLAQEGETVLVTERDLVIAQFGPPLEEGKPSSGQSGLSQAVQKGWITLARRSELKGPPPRIPVARWEELARELAEDRGDR